MSAREKEAGLLYGDGPKLTSAIVEKLSLRPLPFICKQAPTRKQDSDVPTEFKPAVDLIRKEAKRFHLWNRSLKNWKLKRKNEYYQLFTTYDLVNQLLTVKVVVHWKKKQGDVLGAYRYLITSGDVERNDENISFDILWSNDKLSMERKIIKLPWPLSNRDLLYATLQSCTDNEWILDTLTCNEVVKGLKVQKGCVQAFMRGRHHVRRLSKEEYVYTWINQVDLRGRIPSWVITFGLSKIGDSVTASCRLFEDADLKEPNLTAFKAHLRSNGIAKVFSKL